MIVSAAGVIDIALVRSHYANSPSLITSSVTIFSPENTEALKRNY